jgi:nucleoside-diphosphate-sugar epimerase
VSAEAILITGGTGFIGAEIVRQLLERGEEKIHVLHRSGNFQRLQDVLDRVNPILQPAIEQVARPLDDRPARTEWSWEPAYDQEAIVDDFLAELREHPEWYR